MKLVIKTQLSENYGAHDWSGEGDVPQHWKEKPGSHIEVLDFKYADKETTDQYIESVQSLFTSDDDHYRESVLDWAIENDNKLSGFEKFQWKQDKGSVYLPKQIRDNTIVNRFVDHRQQLHESAFEFDKEANGLKPVSQSTSDYSEEANRLHKKYGLRAPSSDLGM